MRPEYINRVYKGRQSCSMVLQEKISGYFGLRYPDALAIGRHILETGAAPAETDTTPAGGAQPEETRFNRRASDRFQQEDIVGFVSQWAAKFKETQTSLAKLQNIIENLSEGIVILDTGLKIEYQNRAHREMFGIHIGMGCNRAHGCEAHIGVCPSVVSQRTGMPASAVFPFARGTVSALTTPIRDTSGTVTGYVTVLRDVTDNYKLMAMSEQAIAMLDRAVLVYDDTNAIRFYNRKLVEITGAREHDLATTETFIHYLEDNRVLKNYRQVAAEMRQANRQRTGAEITVHFRNNRSYRYIAKPMYLSNDIYIGKMALFDPLG